MEVDPLASMRCWAIELELGGRAYDVPALSAADWWPILVSGDLSRLLDFVVSTPQDPFNLDDLLLTGGIKGEELTAALQDAIEEASGRSFHAAYVLATVAANQWPLINGHLAQRGFRWDVMPIGAALDAIYAVVTGRLEKDPLAKFLRLLDDDSLTTGKRRGLNRERIMGEFETLAGPRPTNGVRSTGAPSGSARPRTRTRPRPPRPDGP